MRRFCFTFLYQHFVVVFYTREDLPKMKYITMCIKEGMRLHCPVPFIERELTKVSDVNIYEGLRKKFGNQQIVSCMFQC